MHFRWVVPHLRFLLFLLLLAAQTNGARATSYAEIQDYVEKLESAENWQVRSQAAVALGEITQENEAALTSVIPALVQAFEDADEVVRLRATIALCEIGTPAIPDLIQTLNHSNSMVRSNATFVLKQIGIPALEPLFAAGMDSNDRNRSNILSTLAAIAEQLENDRLDLETEALEAAIANLPTMASDVPDADAVWINLETSGQATSTQVALIQTARNSLQTEIDRRQQAATQQRFNTILSTVFILLFLIFWFRPQLFLQLSRTLVQARQNRSQLDGVLGEVQRFLHQADAITQRHGTRSLQVKAMSTGRLKRYTPLPTLLALEQPAEQDLTELIKQANQMARSAKNQPKAGILLYRESPDAIFRTEMAKVRMRDQFVLIPIPLAAIEQVTPDRNAASGLLANYADRYLPGADLFDDRNAIGDTLSFFGRQEVLQRLEEELRRNQGVGLFGLRKSGKTSLLLQLGFAMRHHPLVHIDLQPYGGKLRSGVNLFNTLVQRLLTLLKERDPKTRLTFTPLLADRPAAEYTTEFVQRVETLAEALFQADYERPLLFFLDEVERILPIETDPKERAEEFNAFFGALRSLSQEKRLISFLIADVHPDCNRINQWPQTGVVTNPVFQFFKETFVFPFAERETAQMLTDIGDLMGVSFDSQTQQTIHQLSGGHPFVARQLASLLYTKVAKSDKSTQDPSNHKNSAQDPSAQDPSAQDPLTQDPLTQDPSAQRGQRNIQFAAAQRYLTRSFTYSGVLKDYFGQNIWGDLTKRNFATAMAILRVLTCNSAANDPDSSSEPVTLSETRLLQTLARQFTAGQCTDALLWLESVGLVDRTETEETDTYRLRVPLLGQWLLMQMTEEEKQEWLLP